jgi:hypothetical protein
VELFARKIIGYIVHSGMVKGAIIFGTCLTSTLKQICCFESEQQVSLKKQKIDSCGQSLAQQTITLQIA